MQRAVHSRFFRCIYRHPKCSDISAGIKVCIHIVSTVVALKRFTISIANIMTNRARLRSVFRINNNQFNSIKGTFISKEQSKLTKAPLTYSSSKFLTFIIGRKSNASQIFNSNSFSLVLGKLNNLFTNGVIDNCNSSLLSSTKTFQGFFTALRSFTLQRTSNLLSFLSVFLERLGVKKLAITKCANIYKSKVTSDKLFNVFNVFFWNLYGLKNVKLFILKNQIRLSFNIRNIFFIVANKWNFNSSSNCRQGNFIIGVRKYPTIISNCTKWTKLTFRFFIQFVSICYFRYATNNHLRGKIKSAFNGMIHFMMQFKLIKKELFKSYFRYAVASRISFFHSSFENIGLFLCRQKFYLQCQFHTSKIQKYFIYLTTIINNKHEGKFIFSLKNQLQVGYLLEL